MMTWLNEIGIAVTAVSAAVTTILTFYLALENRRLRKISSEPEIVVYLKPSSESFTVIEIVFANVGNGPARDVCVAFNADFENVKKHSVHNIQKNQRKLLAAMPSGEVFRLLFGVGYMLFEDGVAMKPIIAIIEYKNIGGKKTSVEFELSVDTWLGMSGPVKSANVDLLEEFKKFSNSTSNELRNISNGIDKIGEFERTSVKRL